MNIIFNIINTQADIGRAGKLATAIEMLLNVSPEQAATLAASKFKLITSYDVINFLSDKKEWDDSIPF